MKKMHYQNFRRPHNFVDYTGQRFGRLVAVEYLPGETNKGRWRCVCDCGGEARTTPANLRRGQTVSCGCARKRPESLLQQNRPLYLVWKEMCARCQRPTHAEYRLYGGRGIKVCDRWQSFANFLADMGQRPEGMSLDRYPNNDGNYEPGNVRWATDKEQARNTRRNRIIEFNGQSKPMAEWCELYGIKRSTVLTRLEFGWTIEEAFTTPVRAWPMQRGTKPNYRAPGVLQPMVHAACTGALS